MYSINTHKQLSHWDIRNKVHLPSMLLGGITTLLTTILYNKYKSSIQSILHSIVFTRQSIDTRESIESLLKYYIQLNGIKTNKRTGWIDSHIELPESVADHQYTMSLIVHTLANQHNNNILTNNFDYINKYDSYYLQIDHSMKLALIHDICESICGDITPEQYSGISKSEKHMIEVNSLDQLCEIIGNEKQSAIELRELWNEYESCSTNEARFVKDIDKLEMCIQAYVYELQQNTDLSEFYDNIRNRLSYTVSIQLYDAIIRQRTKLRTGTSTSSLLSNTPPRRTTAVKHNNSNSTAQQLIKSLKLDEHPEGGWYKRAYTSEFKLLNQKSLNSTVNLHKFPRPLTTSIYYMLCHQQYSAIHKIPCDELWHWYSGDDIVIVELQRNTDNQITGYSETILGNSTQQYVYNVSANTYFSAYRINNKQPSNGYVLVGCTVVPGFELDEWIMPDRKQLIDMYYNTDNNNNQRTEYIELINKLTPDSSSQHDQ